MPILRLAACRPQQPLHNVRSTRTAKRTIPSVSSVFTPGSPARRVLVQWTLAWRYRGTGTGEIGPVKQLLLRPERVHLIHLREVVACTGSCCVARGQAGQPSALAQSCAHGNTFTFTFACFQALVRVLF
jgi:hypothetical protein